MLIFASHKDDGTPPEAGDTPDPRFSRVLRLAGAHFGASAAVLLLGAGEQRRVAASQGLAAEAAAGFAALCARALPAAGVLWLADAGADPRFMSSECLC